MVPENILLEFIPDMICFGVDILICGVIYKVYSKTHTLISAIKNAPEVDLEDCDIGTFLSNYPDTSTTGDGKTLPYVIINGKVAADKGAKLLSNNGLGNMTSAKVRGVIKESSIVEHKRTLSRAGFWYDSSRTIHSYTNDIPFWIIPVSKSSLKDAKSNLVEVKEFARADRLDLEVVSDHFEASSGGIGDHLMGFVIGDRPRGIQTTEKMLCDGSSLTAIGELVQTQNGKFKIQQPHNGLSYFLIKDSAKTLVEDLHSESRILRFALYLFGGVGVFIVGFAAYRYWKKTEEVRRVSATRQRLEQIIQDRPRVQSAAREQRLAVAVEPNAQDDTSSGSSSNSQCVVCYGQAREVIFLDCGHVASCAECAMSIMRTNPVCPICRAAIDRVVPAFIA